ncbi:MAG TPA: 2-oxo acid dehydrogenase subunit E2 [Acholeplasmataceae bacterium]|nr:2-oxo acid dehydrogenase subunit E2 [Acholeplasmataceae bacterium]
MYNFKFADIGEGIHEGQLLKWFFKEGDKINEGDTLCLVETDKVNAEIPSPVTGIIKKLGAKEGDVITVGSVLAVIDDGSGEDSSEEIQAKVETEKEDEPGGVVGDIEVSNEVIATSSEAQDETLEEKRILASPLARKIAADLNVDLTKVKGTGENNRILKADIEAFNQNQKPIEAFLSGEGVKISRTRKAIVDAMTLSKQKIPHSTLMYEINVTKLAEFRCEQKELAAKHNVKLTFMPFIIKAITLIIKEYPIFNARFIDDKISYQNNINIGIAIDTTEGLVVPNIKNADTKSIFDLAKEVSTLAEAAHNRTLQLSQIQNGTFTITNYGSFPTSFGTPIIKYPEVAIIGVGRIIKKPIVEGDEIKIADMMPVSVSFDHRIIDGADVGRFLAKLEQYLNDPMLLLLN